LNVIASKILDEIVGKGGYLFWSVIWWRPCQLS